MILLCSSLLKSNLAPSLGINVILGSFQVYGNFPPCKIEFVMLCSGYKSASSKDLQCRLHNPSAPGTCPDLLLLIAFEASLIVIALFVLL